MTQQSAPAVLSIESVLLQIGNECVDNFQISSPRSSNAMQKLGICNEELWWRPSNDFFPSEKEFKQKKLDIDLANRLRDIRYQNHQEKRYRLMQSIKNLKMELKDEEQSRQKSKVILEKILKIEKNAGNQHATEGSAEGATGKSHQALNIEEELEKKKQEIKETNGNDVIALAKSYAQQNKRRKQTLEKMKQHKEKIQSRSASPSKDLSFSPSPHGNKSKGAATYSVVEKIREIKAREQQEKIQEYLMKMEEKEAKWQQQMEMNQSVYPTMFSPSSLAHARGDIQRREFLKKNKLYCGGERKRGGEGGERGGESGTGGGGDYNATGVTEHNGTGVVAVGSGGKGEGVVGGEERREGRRGGEREEKEEEGEEDKSEKREEVRRRWMEERREKNKKTLEKFLAIYDRKSTWCPQQGTCLEERGRRVEKERKWRRRAQLGDDRRGGEKRGEERTGEESEEIMTLPKDRTMEFVERYLAKEKKINDRRKKEEKVKKVFLMEKKNILEGMAVERASRKKLAEEYHRHCMLEGIKKKNDRYYERKQNKEKLQSEVNAYVSNINLVKEQIKQEFKSPRVKKNKIIQLSNIIGVDVSNYI